MPTHPPSALWVQQFRRSPESKTSLQHQIREMLVAAILDGQLPPDSALPSSRELADQLGEAKTQRELWEFLDEETRGDGVRRQHVLTREPPVEDGDLETTSLFLEYVGSVGDQLQPAAEEWRERGKAFEALQTPWSGSLSRMATRLDAAHVGAEARRLARLWWS